MNVHSQTRRYAMITRDQAVNIGRGWSSEIHQDGCARHIGPRGGITETVIRYRPNGAVKVWKTRPDEFRLPIKFGLRGYGYIDQDNAGQFHLSTDCPLLVTDGAVG